MINKPQIKVILFLSIMINIFLAGVVMSYYATKSDMPHHPPPPHMRGPMPEFESAKLALSSEGQAVVNDIMMRQKNSLRGDIHAMEGTMRNAHALLTASTLDKDALQALHDAMDTNNASMKSALSQMIYDIAGELSDKDRIIFFNRALPKPPPRR